MQAGARFLRFRRKKNHQKINQKSMQNKSEKMIGKFQQKYQFWDGFGKGFGRVWEGLEGIKIRWKKDVKIRGRGPQVPIAALGHDLYRGGLPWISPPLSGLSKEVWRPHNMMTCPGFLALAVRLLWTVVLALAAPQKG